MGGAIGHSAATSDPTFTAVYDSYQKALIVEFEAFDYLNHQRKGAIMEFLLYYLCSCGLIMENETSMVEDDHQDPTVSTRTQELLSSRKRLLDDSEDDGSVQVAAMDQVKSIFCIYCYIILQY
jgi:hypothetical protein